MSKLVEKILKEDYRQNLLTTVIDYIPDLGKKIGGDVNGIAFDYDGKVFKVTTSFDEARLCNLLIKHPTKHFAKIYSVEEIYLDEKTTNTFAIIREKLDELSNIDYNILSVFAEDLEYYQEFNIQEENNELNEYDKRYVWKLYDEYRILRKELDKYKMFDLFPKNLGRKKDGTLAAFDAETHISFGDAKLSILYLNKFEDKDINESILKEWNDSLPNTHNYPDQLSNDFEEYMSEATAESLTMETGAIPNSLDETIKIMEVLKKIEKSIK